MAETLSAINPKPFFAAGVTLQPEGLCSVYQAAFKTTSETEEILSQPWKLGAPSSASGDGGKTHCLLQTWHGAVVRLSCRACGETAGQREDLWLENFLR